jgi:hypothetical protein
MLVYLIVIAACAAGTAKLWAEPNDNPYYGIVERNAFALKPPPPPPDPTPPPPPATPPATVELTGITSILSSKRALLEITPGPGKPPIKPILAEGERIESVEVVLIDVEKNQVTIRNGGIETNITFKVAKSSPTPGAPGVPPVPGIPPPSPTPAGAHLRNPAAAAAPGGPIIISPNSGNAASGSDNVTVYGAQTAGAPAQPATPGVTSLGVTSTTGTGAASATGLGGLRTIPTRQLRTDPGGSREEVFRRMEEARAANQGNPNVGIIPPTPYSLQRPPPPPPPGE